MYVNNQLITISDRVSNLFKGLIVLLSVLLTLQAAVVLAGGGGGGRRGVRAFVQKDLIGGIWRWL
jgi:hypothetical protein